MVCQTWFPVDFPLKTKPFKLGDLEQSTHLGAKFCRATCLSLYAFIKFALYTRPFLLAYWGILNGNMLWLHMDYIYAHGNPMKPSIPQSLNHFLKIKKDRREEAYQSPQGTRHLALSQTGLPPLCQVYHLSG